MEITFVAPLLNTEIEDLKGGYIFEKGYFFVPGKDIQLSPYFLESLGSIHLKYVRKNHCLVFGEKHELSKPELNPILHSNIASINSFLIGFWLIKDNCINLTYLYSYYDNEIFINSWFKSISNSRGEYQNVPFTSEEVKKAMEMFFKINDMFISGGALEGALKSKTNDVGYTVSGANYVPYNDTDRIYRCLHFINAARSESFLPHRISLYMVAFECLFSDSANTEAIAFKIKYRVPKFLNLSTDRRQAVFDLLGKAYGVRSKYLHGSVLKGGMKLYEHLKPVSVEIDSLLREIVLKLIEDDDCREILKDEKLFERYFHEVFLN